MAGDERFRVVVQVGRHIGWRRCRTRRLAQRAWEMQVPLPMETGWLCWIEPDGEDPPAIR